MSEEHLDLWGEKMPILHSESITVRGNTFPLHEVTASDDTRAVVMICTEHIADDTRDVVSLIKRLMKRQGLHPTFAQSGEHQFLESISPLDAKLSQRFGEHRRGIIALVNGKEPGYGEHTVNEMALRKGDTFQLLYRIGTATTAHAQ